MAVSRSQRLMAGVLLTAIFNGCTMGYDQSMMNSVNALDQYVGYFNLDSSMLGLNTAIINVGSVVGGLFAGQFSDSYGRKWGVVLSALITFVGVTIQASAVHQAMFCIGRFLLGVSITVNATAAPIWVMELAHPKHKGWMGGVYMASWYLAATVTSGISLRTYTIPNTWAWRALSIGQAVPSMLAMTMVWFLPESPRWLMYHDGSDEALQVLKDVHGDGDTTPLVLAEFQEIRETIEFEKSNPSTWKALIAPKSNFRRFVLVLLINLFAQIVGSNIVSSYLSILLELAGVTDTRTQLVINLGNNVWNLLCSLVGSFLPDYVGRKPMLFWSTVFMTVFLCLEAIMVALFGDESASQHGKNAAVAFAFLLLGTYSIAYTPLTYTYPIEVLNYKQRAKGVGLGHSFCFCFGFLNQFTIPIAMEAIAWRYYIINAAWNVVIAGLIWFLFVETKGLTLEEVDQVFDGTTHSDAVHIGNGANIEDAINRKLANADDGEANL